ncbi:GIY-YIG nuclease family protein [Aromatoleum sp.]|uniref:GIY-YIG nuclease family protein n=1 Tax=Aromatoleum sp. TaxID=2307007 RepID=UPI002FCC6CA5
MTSSSTLRPQTIQIFLPLGDPRSIRVAEITTRIVQVIEVPRPQLDAFLQMPESDQVAVYFLFGQSEDGADAKVYIGQTGDLRKRLAIHNKEKDFWQRALVLISRTNTLTQTHGLFLEWQCIQTARQAGRYRTENGNAGTKPHTPAPLEADCMEIFDTGRTLLATLGYPLFEPVANLPGPLAEAEVFYCRRAGADARGEYTPEGFVVLKGSKGRVQIAKGFENHSFAKRRDELIAQGKIVIENGATVFADDVLFLSPSGASAVVCAAASNGWLDWKNARGETLDDVKRGNSTASSSC